jgi:hypothetical protein
MSSIARVTPTATGSETGGDAVGLELDERGPSRTSDRGRVAQIDGERLVHGDTRASSAR